MMLLAVSWSVMWVVQRGSRAATKIGMKVVVGGSGGVVEVGVQALGVVHGFGEGLVDVDEPLPAADGGP
jgi:hypothetical protein